MGRDMSCTDSVSVIIAHYGDPEVAASLVRDLQAQVIEQAVEIIVVDDCSPKPFPETPGTAVVRRERNGGFGAAVNSGVTRVQANG